MLHMEMYLFNKIHYSSVEENVYSLQKVRPMLILILFRALSHSLFAYRLVFFFKMGYSPEVGDGMLHVNLSHFF